MTSTRIAEAKGLLFLVFVIGLLVVSMLGFSGKLEDWFGIRLFKPPDVSGRIVFVSDRNGHNDIWVMERDGSNPKALTNDKYDDHSPVWSPDGTEIVFVSDRDNGKYQLYAISYKGDKIRKLSKSSGTKSWPVFSPDGDDMAYVSAGKIFKREVNGTREEQVMPEVHMRESSAGVFAKPGWCSTGTWLAAVQKVDGAEIVTLQDASSEELAVAKDDQERPLGGELVDVAWSTGGQRLVTAIYNGAYGNYVGVVDLDRETFYNLLQSGDQKHAILQPAWSPDDSAIAFIATIVKNAHDLTPIGLMTMDAGDGTTSELDQGHCDQPRWSRDGKSIIYTKMVDGTKDVWLVDIDGEKPVNLTVGKGSNFDASWSPGVPK